MSTQIDLHKKQFLKFILVKSAVFAAEILLFRALSNAMFNHPSMVFNKWFRFHL